jgi:multiple antibiotic resistance protein
VNLSSDTTFFVNAYVGLLSILDPLGAIPILLSLTQSRGVAQTRRIVTTTIIACAVAVYTVAFFGSAILDFFGISMPAFRASGGILILLMAIQMMQGESRRAKHTPEEHAEAAERENIAVVPIAIPLLVGPGTMSTTVLLSHRAETMELQAVLIVAIAAVIATTWLCLSLSEVIRRLLGESGLRIASRIMGLLLAALAVQFIADGLRELFPGLVRTVP